MKAIIVEDEFPAREELKYFITNYSQIDVINEFDNGVDVLKFIQENEIDVIFLDINIPLLDGMILARTINQFKVKPKIVFITAYKDYAVDAFELEAFDYILKPYSDERIISMLSKLEKTQNIENNKEVETKNEILLKDTVSLWSGNKLRVVNVNDIYYCEAKERETIVYTKDDSYIAKSCITEFYNNIPSNIFLKTHRSYIVNLLKIREIIPWFNNTYKLKLNNIDDEVFVSRSKIKEFKQKMNI